MSGLERPYSIKMLGHKGLPKVAKMAIVIYEYSRDTKGNKAKQISRTMLLKIIKDLETGDQKYNVTLGDQLRSESLRTLYNDSKKFKYMDVWMLQLNQYMHVIIHDLAQDYDPASKGKSSDQFFIPIYNEMIK